MRLTSTNKKWYKAATIELRTVRLPSYTTSNETFESHLFENGKSKKLSTYATIKEAMQGHEHLRVMYGLK
jgi:hypothetical protein